MWIFYIYTFCIYIYIHFVYIYIYIYILYIYIYKILSNIFLEQLIVCLFIFRMLISCFFHKFPTTWTFKKIQTRQIFPDSSPENFFHKVLTILHFRSPVQPSCTWWPHAKHKQLFSTSRIKPLSKSRKGAVKTPHLIGLCWIHGMWALLNSQFTLCLTHA
jgi:hypothetical protein